MEPWGHCDTADPRRPLGLRNLVEPRVHCSTVGPCGTKGSTVTLWDLREQWSRRWAELQQGAELWLLGAELWLLGAEPGPAGLRDGHEGALRAIHKRPGQSRAELSAILAAGAEPEVLVSIKALFKAREVELQRPHPHRAANHPGKAQESPDWWEQAEAVLIGQSPEAVLWALEVLANQSTRDLLAGPTPSAEAPPTLKSLLQQRLRFLSAATRGRRAALGALQEQGIKISDLPGACGVCPWLTCCADLCRAERKSFR
ncbi:uncharacterized protein LOC132087186 [Ammospiza nelsoni]|uniref:uncharacterized protein LOC132087186 n=1 Tax=Ammospiza nelsoni TaxID=2857394 RepID=UPI002869C155|nr:uncharacterized protein LOC132087186 [Ammospiza nelsoni]